MARRMLRRKLVELEMNEMSRVLYRLACHVPLQVGFYQQFLEVSLRFTAFNTYMSVLVKLFSYLTSLILKIDCPVRNDADEEEDDDEGKVHPRQAVPGGRLQHLAQLRLPPAVLPGAPAMRFNIQ